MTRLVGAGALVALLGTFFSLAYAGSRQFYHLAQAGFLPRVFGSVNARHAPAAAVYLVGVIALATAAFPPNSAMVVFIFLISVSHVLLLAAFLRLRQQEPQLARSYRALGGSPIAVVALFPVARGHGVLLPARGARLADRHRGDRRAGRAVRVAQAGAVAGLVSHHRLSRGFVMNVDLSGKVAIVTGCRPGHRRRHRTRFRQSRRQGGDCHTQPGERSGGRRFHRQGRRGRLAQPDRCGAPQRSEARRRADGGALRTARHRGAQCGRLSGAVDRATLR